jgi:hypothetical protein
MGHLDFEVSELAALALAILLSALFLCAVGCAPKTDLFGQAPGGAGEPAGGSAAGSLVDPRAGTTDVPSNLAAIVARLPSPIMVAAGLFRLRPSDGAAGGAAAEIDLGLPDPVACASAGACYRVPVTAALAPTRTYLFELLPGAVAPGGGAVPTGAIGAFDTAAGADQIAPSLLDFTVTAGGPCLGLQFSADEPVDAQVVITTVDDQRIFPGGAGQTAFDLAIPLDGLAPGASATITLRLTDRAGNLTESSLGQVDVPPATPPLVITEVLANAAGPEPAQEYVELRNLGDQAVSVEGLRIEDAKGADVLPAATVEPGAYALVVPSAYDPASGRDVPPRDGTVLIRIDTRIGSDGLSNGGEVVRLRMPGTGMEPIVSSYGGWVDVSATSAAGKSVHRLSDGACDRADAWTQPPREETPGWGTP